MGDIMIEIDVTELKNDIASLGALIDEYEEIELNLYSQLKDSCINWQDGNSVLFDSKIYMEKRESELFLQSVKSRREALDFIYSKYSEIGKKIKCNLDNKKTVIGAIDSCYTEAIRILNEFQRIDRSFYYSEQSLIEIQRGKVIDSRNRLRDLKTAAMNTFSKIEEIEKEIETKLKSLEQIKINDFSFNLN